MKTKMMRCYLAFFLTFSITLGNTLVLQDQCDLKTFDRCGIKVTWYKEEDGSVAETPEDFHKHCRRKQEGLNCMSEFGNRCFSDLELQESLDIIFGLASKMAGTKCDEDRLEVFLQKHRYCMLENIDHLQGQVEKFVRQIDAILTEKTNDRLNMLCCAFLYAKESTVNGLIGKCRNDTLDFLQYMFGFGYKDASRIICPNFQPSSNECKQLNLPPPTTDESTLKWISPFPGILSIITEIDLHELKKV